VRNDCTNLHDVIAFKACVVNTHSVRTSNLKLPPIPYVTIYPTLLSTTNGALCYFQQAAVYHIIVTGLA